MAKKEIETTPKKTVKKKTYAEMTREERVTGKPPLEETVTAKGE